MTQATTGMKRTRAAMPLKKDKPEDNSQKNYDLDDLLGKKKVRRDCTVTGRISIKMKEHIKSICKERDTNESEIINMLLKKYFKID